MTENSNKIIYSFRDSTVHFERIIDENNLHMFNKGIEEKKITDFFSDYGYCIVGFSLDDIDTSSRTLLVHLVNSYAGSDFDSVQRNIFNNNDDQLTKNYIDISKHLLSENTQIVERCDEVSVSSQDNHTALNKYPVPIHNDYIFDKVSDIFSHSHSSHKYLESHIFNINILTSTLDVKNSNIFRWISTFFLDRDNVEIGTEKIKTPCKNKHLTALCICDIPHFFDNDVTLRRPKSKTEELESYHQAAIHSQVQVSVFIHLFTNFESQKKCCFYTTTKRNKKPKHGILCNTDTIHSRSNNYCSNSSGIQSGFNFRKKSNKFNFLASFKQIYHKMLAFDVSSCYCILNNIVSKFMLLLKWSHKVIFLSRPLRLFRLLRSEAHNYGPLAGHDNRFIDLGLIIKLFFVCYVFTIKLKSRQARVGRVGDEHNDLILSFWLQYRVIIFLVCLCIVYCLKTGIIRFLYDVLIRKGNLRTIWRNEDIINQVDDETPSEEIDRVHSHHINKIVLNKSGGKNQVITSTFTMRRGRRDKVPRCNVIFNHNAANIPIHMSNTDHRGLEGKIIFPSLFIIDFSYVAHFISDFKRALMNSFVSGAIHVRKVNGDKSEVSTFKVKDKAQLKHNNMLNIINKNNNTFTSNTEVVHAENQLDHMTTLREFLMDIIYLFGSLFLSLLPMWRPWMVEVIFHDGAEDSQKKPS